MAFTIRPAKESDREAMYRVCLLTGDSGADGTHLFPHQPQLLGQRWVGPYLTLEPGLAFVLEHA